MALQLQRGQSQVRQIGDEDELIRWNRAIQVDTKMVGAQGRLPSITLSVFLLLVLSCGAFEKRARSEGDVTRARRA